MKNSVLVLAVAGLFTLVGCASFKSLPESDLSAIVSHELGVRSQVEPLELTLEPSYNGERLTLIRVIVVTNNGKGSTGSSAAADSLLGLSFGNGLYLDNNGNLVVLINKYLGIDGSFVGSTLFHGWVFGGFGGIPIVTTGTYSPGKIVFRTTGTMFGNNGTIEIDAKKVTGFSETIFFNAKNTKLQPSLFIPLVSKEYVWEKTATGYRKTWSLFDSSEYSLVDGKVTDKDKSFVVENNGEYLRLQYTKGDRFAFRIYRSPGKVVVLDENTGAFTTIKIEGNAATWKQQEHNAMGASGKLVDYKLEKLN